MATPKKQLPDTLKRALRGEVKDPQLSEMAAHFIHAMGGPKKFAILLVQEFNSAKEGSFVRQRILDMIMRMVKFANEKAGRPSDDSSLLTDEDLDREIQEHMREMPDERQEKEPEQDGPERGAEAAS